MKVREVMTAGVKYLDSSATVDKAAQQMQADDIGFLPIRDEQNDKLQGVVTDRDIVTRVIASGLDPASTPVGKAQTEKVLYCFEDDDLDKAVDSLRKQQVHRLVVLDNEQNKRLTGTLSVGDLVRANQHDMAEKALKDILSDAA